uniref:Uncharacterized protein n=1 Tax=Romanomermis culicivorax TaxID=13658 RepID=A0A915JHY5_ROMCU
MMQFSVLGNEGEKLYENGPKNTPSKYDMRLIYNLPFPTERNEMKSTECNRTKRKFSFRSVGDYRWPFPAKLQLSFPIKIVVVPVIINLRKRTTAEAHLEEMFYSKKSS